MSNEFSRTERLFGAQAMEQLQKSHVAVFGLGGVGGYVVEALARSGVGHLTLIDNDVFSVTNLNRQLLSTQQTIGRRKTEVAKERVLSINPQAEVTILDLFFMPETAEKIDFSTFDYVVDAIDTVTGKLTIIERATAVNTPVISCMGTGNKVDPTALTVADIYKTSGDPLAKVMRAELKKRGVKKLKVVYSSEPPILCDTPTENGRHIPASCAFVPSVAGFILAGEVVKDITNVSFNRKGKCDPAQGKQ